MTQTLKARFLASLLLGIGFASCTSVSPAANYRDLDADSRLLFLQYYKTMKPDQRKEILEGSWPARGLLKKWKLLNPAIEALGRPSLGITMKATIPLRSGQSVVLKAQLQYADGTTADATPDVHWTVLPAIAHVELKGGKATLVFGCAVADAEVSASLLDAVNASLPVQFRKKVRALSLDLSAPSKDFEDSEYLQLKATATCEDGTQSDVSCQANWFTDPAIGQFSGCGNLYIASKQNLREGQVPASATYAGITASQTFRFSPRGTQ